VGDIAYTLASQSLLFQIDYFRDPMRVSTLAYKKFSQLAQWNNEGDAPNATYKANFVKVERFILVKAEKDTMVFPSEGEHWGHFADNSLTKVLPMRQTHWYKSDLFGLKTVDEAGKIFFNTTAGDHLDFSRAELNGWLSLFV
jgi:palmitoyl-protein thioesterase